MSEHGIVVGDVMPVAVMARRERWSRGVSIYMQRVIVGVCVYIAEPINFRRLTMDQAMSTVADVPTIQLSIQSAQQLMDELWQCGLRPTEGTGSAGSLAATQRHLDDMRKLVFEPQAK